MRLATSEFHPGVIGTYLLGLFLFSMLLFHPLFLILTMTQLLIFHKLFGDWRQVKEWLPFFFGMIGILIVINALLVHRGSHVLFTLHQPITLEAILYGGTLGLLIVTMFLIFMTYNILLPSEKFLYLAGKFLPKTALLVMMSLRMVPLLKQRITEIQAARRVRFSPSSDWFIQMKHHMQVVMTLTTWSLEEALESADSMHARGYGQRKRSVYEPYDWDRRDSVVVTFLVVSLLFIGWGWIQGYGVFTIYPVMEPLFTDSFEWVLAWLWLIWGAWPIWMEGGEWFRWHLLK
ncbi:energy-coupling factor transporter transmembrane component T [Hazenella coriacea]|uniref:Energy-coupling factor transport system permease protein n=1 Tax=Hazenella coriacea TaxID=1179467 RepID=A0A4R3L3I4_9BACL|nr:energy-coupling factor transporter transmembrane component T [Hazenella coriacea]TCS93822.1 energy-coupling factor transport system permease protein [Hazenella coriacea]